jgi:hypothetical protein
LASALSENSSRVSRQTAAGSAGARRICRRPDSSLEKSRMSLTVESRAAPAFDALAI